MEDGGERQWVDEIEGVYLGSTDPLYVVHNEKSTRKRRAGYTNINRPQPHDHVADP